MNAAETRDLSDDELADKLIELKREQFNLRFQSASGQLEKTGRVRQIRRDVARIKTIQTERRKPDAEAAMTQTKAVEPAAQAPAPQAETEQQVSTDA